MKRLDNTVLLLFDVDQVAIGLLVPLELPWVRIRNAANIAGELVGEHDLGCRTDLVGTDYISIHRGILSHMCIILFSVIITVRSVILVLVHGEQDAHQAGCILTTDMTAATLTYY